MKISVCIPVYNTDVSQLVKVLHSQIVELNEQVDLICIDDASSNKKLRYSNKELISKLGYKFVQLQKNIGRSKIRNLFLKHSSAKYFLFLDDDAIPVHQNFLKNYLESIRKNPNCVYGSINVNDSPKPTLREIYRKNVEVKSLQERLNEPYVNFKSNNFLIKRAVFEKQKFNEKMKGYGHEDTLFAHKLMQRRLGVMHIDNPVYHADKDGDKKFLANTKNGLQNLAGLYFKKGDSFKKFVKILNVYDSLSKRKLNYILLIFSPLLLLVSRVMINLRIVPLKAFNLYKLCHLNHYIIFNKQQ